MSEDFRKKIIEERWLAAENPEITPKDSKLIINDQGLPIIYRTAFDRDRDRILYSTIFRRLNGKTQIFLPYSHDYIRTRLTHTLEVSQLAKAIAKGLGLNLSLVEAIAIGHDVGHTPFGHAGERELNRIMNGCATQGENEYAILKDKKGFKHNYQAVRSLEVLTKFYDQEGYGLNLTPQTLWGILNHTKLGYKICEFYSGDEKKQCLRYNSNSKCHLNGYTKLGFYENIRPYIHLPENGEPAWSFEGLVVNIADEIAQFHHDLEDSLFMGIMTIGEIRNYLKKHFSKYIHSIPNEDIKASYLEIFDQINKTQDKITFMWWVAKLVIDILLNDIIHHSIEVIAIFLNEKDISDKEAYKRFIKTFAYQSCQDTFQSTEGSKKFTNNRFLRFSDELDEQVKILRKDFTDRVINSSEVHRLNYLAQKVIADLFTEFFKNPKLLPDKTLHRFTKNCIEENVPIGELIKAEKPEDDTDSVAYLNYEKSMVGSIRRNISQITEDEDAKRILMRTIADHLSGMTDKYALAIHKDIFGSEF